MHAPFHDPTSRTPSSQALLLGSVALALGACRTTEPPTFAPPRLSLEAYHFAGTPLTGPVFPDASAIETSDVVAVSFRLVYLEHMPHTELASLAARTRFLGAMRGADPVPSSAVLAEGARVGVGNDAEDFLDELERGAFGRSVELGVLTCALPKLETGVTAVFEANSERTFDVPDVGTVQTKLSLCVARADAPWQAADAERELRALLVVEDRRAESEATLSATGTPEAPFLRELIGLADEPSPGGGPLVVVLRSPFGVEADGRRSPAAHGTGSFVAVLTAASLAAAPDAGDPASDAGWEALARCREELALGGPRGDSFLASHGSLVTQANALDALEDPRFQRSGLLFLATASGAELAEDVALAAEEPELADFVARILAERASGAAEPALDWLLERNAYTFLASLLLDSPPLPRELSGVFLRHAGELGRYPEFLRGIVAECGDVATLQSRIFAANADFLEDQNPGARMRAYEWFVARGRAPEGFDPLAPEDARRAALESSRSTLEAALEVGAP